MLNVVTCLKIFDCFSVLKSSKLDDEKNKYNKIENLSIFVQTVKNKDYFVSKNQMFIQKSSVADLFHFDMDPFLKTFSYQKYIYIFVILVDFCGIFPWFWLTFAIRIRFMKRIRIRLTKMNRIQIRNTEKTRTNHYWFQLDWLAYWDMQHQRGKRF